MKQYRIEKIGPGYYVQRYGLVMLDGCPDYMWKDIARFDDEESAREYINNLEISK